MIATGPESVNTHSGEVLGFLESTQGSQIPGGKHVVSGHVPWISLLDDQRKRFGQSLLGRREVAEASEDIGMHKEGPAQFGRVGLAQIGEGHLEGIECSVTEMDEWEGFFWR